MTLSSLFLYESAMDELSLIYTFIYNIIVPFIPAIDKSHVLCILCMQTKNPCNSPNFNNAREKTLQKSNLGQDYDWDQFYIIPIKFKHVFMSRLAGQNDAPFPLHVHVTSFPPFRQTAIHTLFIAFIQYINRIISNSIETDIIYHYILISLFNK